MRSNKVDVYWNLRKGGYSVRQHGRVIDHTNRIILRDARFVVQRGGWLRTVRERRKRVHAMVRGQIIDPACWLPAPKTAIAVSYNPYRADHFHTASGERIDDARVVWFSVRDGKPIVEIDA